MISIEVPGHFDAMILIALYDAMRYDPDGESTDERDMMVAIGRALSFIQLQAILDELETSAGYNVAEEYARRLLDILRGRVADIEKYLEAQP